MTCVVTNYPSCNNLEVPEDDNPLNRFAAMSGGSLRVRGCWLMTHTHTPSLLFMYSYPFGVDTFTSADRNDDSTTR
jgi:hypothetical protein